MRRTNHQKVAQVSLRKETVYHLVFRSHLFSSEGALFTRYTRLAIGEGVDGDGDGDGVGNPRVGNNF